MKQMKSIILAMLTALCALPASARDFEYEGLIYTVIDEEAHTCKTKEGIPVDYNTMEPGNNVEGNIVIPSIALDGTVQYTVMEIGNYSFFDCTELTSITIPESVTSIGELAFGLCTSLTSIDLPDSLTLIGELAFCRCTSLTSIDLPGSLTLIGIGAFEGCSSLTSIDLPDSVTSIGGGAFGGCTSLTSIDIPASVTEIGPSTFYGCSSLTSIDIPASVTEIGPSTFYGCSSLTSIDIPASVTWIGHKAFLGCTSLTSIDLPDSVTWIGPAAFNGCSSLTSIDLPDLVTEIRENAFGGCSSLTLIDLPDSLTNIGDWAFYGCSRLTSIDLPDSLTNIGDWAFYVCSRLTSIDLPDSLTRIGDWAFSECTSLTSIEIPASVTYIGFGAFDMMLLREITYLATNPITAYANVFSDESYQSATLNAPNASLADIQATVPWSLFGHINARDGSVGSAETVTDFEYEGIWYSVIDSEAKTCKTKDYGNVGVRGDVVIPEVASDGANEFRVIEIGDRGFIGSSGLLSISLPSSIERVGENAFSGCGCMTSFIWHVNRKMQSSVVEAIGNPNLLLYVDSIQFAPQGMERNVVADGLCENLILTPGYPFKPAVDFSANYCSMTKEFTQITPIDGCAGWETIVLPFDATSVRVKDARGELTPFPLVTDINRQFPYWIYQADSEGEWTLADGIREGVPYLVAMPNNPEYKVRYNIDGPVTFSCNGPTRIRASVSTPYAVTWASGREFRSLWLPLDDEEAADAMGLNVNLDNLTDDYGVELEAGSAFNVGVVPKPLEAYVTRNGGARAFRISSAQTSVIRIPEEDGLKITEEGGILYLQTNDDRVLDIFSVDGTAVRRVWLKGGIPCTVDDLTYGIYIVAGRKVMIR